MLSKNKQMQPNYVLVRPTEKVGGKSVTSGKNESRALHTHLNTQIKDLK